MTFRIYGLSDPRLPDLWKYVGATVGALEARLTQHISDTKACIKAGGKLSRREEWVWMLLQSGLRPKITELAIATGAYQAEQLECEFIKRLRPLGFITNSMHYQGYSKHTFKS